jgi:hypothetical protein
MKYAIIREDGATEIREDSYPLQANAIALTDEQHTQLISGKYILQNGEVVANPNVRTLGN